MRQSSEQRISLIHVLLGLKCRPAYIAAAKMVSIQMKEAAQCRQFDELRTGDGMVGQVLFTTLAADSY